MANTKSITKILNYLKTQNRAVSPSEICSNVNLQWVTVKEVLEILSQIEQITILSSGPTTLVKMKLEAAAYAKSN